MDTTNRMHLSWVICRVSCNFSEIFIYSLKILYICVLIISTSLSPNFPQEPISTSCLAPFYFCFNLLSDHRIKESDSPFPQLPETENSSAGSEAFEALLLGLAFVTGLMLPVQFHITRSLTKLSCHVLQQQKHRECLKVSFHVIFKVLGWVEQWTGQKRGDLAGAGGVRDIFIRELKRVDWQEHQCCESVRLVLSQGKKIFRLCFGRSINNLSLWALSHCGLSRDGGGAERPRQGIIRQNGQTWGMAVCFLVGEVYFSERGWEYIFHY